MPDLTLLTLPPSPFNIKVRLALGAKGLDYDAHTCSGFDGREKMIEATGQPLTPVLKHEGRAIYDSFGITRYLDANWPHEPRLYREERDDMRSIERWENLTRNGLGPLLGQVIGGCLEGKSAEELEPMNRMFNEYAPRVESALESNDYLVDDRISAADLAVAPFFHYSTLDPSGRPPQALSTMLAGVIRLAPQYVRTRAWVDRVMKHDRQPVEA